jgi:phosphoribosyl-AMP cyclohydrolase
MASQNPSNRIDFAKGGGLVTAVAQDFATGEVLMVAHMNEESFARTLATGKAVYYSRSRGGLWEKGEQSGHHQIVRSIQVDCDGDAVLLKVEQHGGGCCHLGYRSCFFREVTSNGWREMTKPVFDAATVYKKKESGR